MPPLALLMATDHWHKVQVHIDFLTHHQPTVWRTQRRYSQNWIDKFTFPLNLYFFHLNEIRYRARVPSIHRGSEWPLVDIPPQNHSDSTPYTLFIVIDHITPISHLPIHAFSKWDDPRQHFHRGQQGLLRVRVLSE